MGVCVCDCVFVCVIQHRNDCTLIRTYADLTFLFSSEVHDLFQLLCTWYYLDSVLICFPPEVIFRFRVIGACPVTRDCIVAMS